MVLYDLPRNECLWVYAYATVGPHIYLLLVAGTNVEHGHRAVGGTVARHKLLGAHVWGLERRGCRC